MTTSRTTGSSSTTRITLILLFWLPLGVVAARPVLRDRSDRHPAHGMAGGGVDHSEVKVPDEEREGGERNPVVQDHSAREAKPRVAFAEPEQHTRDDEERH